MASIEHNAYWFKLVQSELRQKGIQNVDYRLIPPMKHEKTAEIDWAIEWPWYRYFQRPPDAPELLNYFNAINDYPDEYFDFILVDGKARVACMLNAISKLRVGGLLILDNSNFFTEHFQLLESWKNIHTTDQCTGDTDIWIKPNQMQLETKPGIAPNARESELTR